MAIKEIIIESIIASLPVGLIVIDPRGDLVTVNQAASDILGYPTGELLWRRWGELFFGDEANDEFNQVILDAIEHKGFGLRRTTQFTRPDGAVLKLFLTTSFVMDADGIAGIVVLMDDITELSMLHEREKTILEEKNRIQVERVESLRNLALAVAHQIRNPAMTIGGFALRLRKRLPDGAEEDARYLQFILDGTERLERIVTAVKAYAEYDEPQWRTVAVDEVVRSAVSAFREKKEDSFKTVQWGLDLTPVRAPLDARLFSMALRELFSNSVQSLREGRGNIRVILTDVGDGGEWRLDVEDDGVGISASDLPYVQDPFFTTRADAVGLGLSRVRRIVSEHGGRLDLESQSGAGTRVSIRMPINREM